MQALEQRVHPLDSRNTTNREGKILGTGDAINRTRTRQGLIEGCVAEGKWAGQGEHIADIKKGCIQKLRHQAMILQAVFAYETDFEQV